MKKNGRKPKPIIWTKRHVREISHHQSKKWHIITVNCGPDTPLIYLTAEAMVIDGRKESLRAVFARCLSKAYHQGRQNGIEELQQKIRSAIGAARL